MKNLVISFLILLISCLGTLAGAKEKPALEQVAVPFGVREVKLLDGPFLHAQDLDARWLLSLDPDRLLSWYRKEGKLEPQGEVYGGWESMGVAGHSLGHYLSACARMYHATGQEEFKRRVDYIVADLAKCQQAGGDGYLAAIPRGREVFAEVARGDIRSQGFDLNGSWVPWYTLHKLFAGLIDSYYLCGNEQAKEVAIKLADWADETTKNLTPEQWQKMLACEHGGMNESLAELYAITGDEKYLQLAEKFYHKAILDPLVEGKDSLAGKHANTQVPKAIGAARIAELTSDQKFAKIARAFWDIMVGSHTYVIGGNSFGEHLGEPGKLNDRLGDNTTETCNTYNMLKLTSALFADKPAAKYADYAERALWNHILASQSSESGMVCYYVPLRAGATKPFQGPEAFTCCSGSGMENHARYGEYIYAHSDDALWVNQFISSELNWQDKGVQLKQLTQLPDNGKTRIEVACNAPQEFTLNVRHPHWVESGYRVTVNGKEIESPSGPASYVAIKRTWKSGDVIEIDTPLTLHLESMPDNPRRVAVFYGPLVLAGELEGQGDGLLPVLVTNDKPVSEWLKPVEGRVAFRTNGVGRPGDQTLVPFFGVHGDTRYIVYWDIFNEDEWQQRQQEYEAERERERQLAERTVDYFAIGEMQPERDHKVEGEKTSAGEHGGRKFRHAQDGGWFSCELTLPKDKPADLLVTYWGSESGPRTFDLLLDGQKIATQSLHQDDPEKFWQKTYPLPDELTAGKEKAVLKFQAHPGNMAGGVFGIRLVRRPE
jgi:DUF1680 family protein